MNKKKQVATPLPAPQSQNSILDEVEDEREEGEENDNSPEGARTSMASMLYSNEDWEEDLEENQLLKNVHFHPLDSKNETVLWETQPDYVIMYCPDVAFVRQIELFQVLPHVSLDHSSHSSANFEAENLDKPIKLYLIYYDNSVEQTTFRAQVQRENDIFANLIENKGRITIPLDVGELNKGAVRINEEKEIQVGGKSASGKKKAIMVHRERKQRIIVDMREFMSKLPAVLHRSGFLLYPVTLEVETLPRFY